ncbi:hypothetical protein ERO13_D05G306100v2 [Gossypium hirsutum]|uniref:Uncharacterized protein isoform X2 n=3 Tax=Gossypium TaxID=3633 RepID=A0A1U8J5N3_GOSHI|nr:uncharacterized protein LOC107903930 isoform X2 [Gossypium hirsutum]KAG4148796.1 hypothetical protein ERO13_D05G306100v2 [Gossypium hirsutum]TYH73648.1 hypothetical protein ES332_D05G344000v1 [Gossypium tomentosum]TYI83992.1 hypothetical protein E1A91_D05G332700v1 [Gossypium mustelinum]
MICSTASSLPIYFDERISITSTKILKTSSSSSSPCYLPLNCSVLHKSFVPLAASVTILLSPIPAKAGLLSGFPGIESIPGPQLPEIEFLNRFNEENQKKYAEADARFKSSPLLKQLLERSKQNKEKNKQEIQDKYCMRGAEWGVGDCSVEAMSPEDKENFIAMLKEKAGIK